VIELQMATFGAGIGLVMTPATNSIMSAVPREKAGAGSAVNNTVRQVAAALGVAILGSLLAVAFRSHLGSDAPARLASQLDQPAAVVATLPPDAQVRTQVKTDASESIGGALEFVGKATGALEQRAGATGVSPTPAQRDEAEAAIGEFVNHSKNSFMSAMRYTSVVSGAIGLVGAIAAFLFLPTRREHEELSAETVPAPGEPAMAH
jgi:DHA2 family integral membrane protein (MFS transporter)